MDNDFSVCRVNFRGVGKSDGEFDNGQGELADAAAALDWLERENFDNSQCWVSGFSFGSLIAMQLLMRRPEINRFIAISPQPNVYDFSFLSPCPTSGLMIYGKKDELVPLEYITELDKRLSAQKGIKVEVQAVGDANHVYSKSENELVKNLDKYILMFKELTGNSSIKYKISDVLTFYKANNGSFNSLNSLLGQRSEFVLKNNFGKRTVKEVVSGERDELMNIMLNSLNESVADLGVEIIDFRVKRIDLPSNLSNSVYERMRTERNRLAEELRSEGKEISREIRAVADKDKVVILAEAYKKAELLRGEGDAEAARIYAEGFSQNPEFYEFTRSIKAYVDTFENKSDVMLIDANSEFLKYLNQKEISN